MYSSVDTIWVLFGAVLVFFMQAGFAMVEAGFTRAKNAGNIIMKNLMDFSIGTVVYWAVGFSLMFGINYGGFIGLPDLFGLGGTTLAMVPEGVPPMAFLIFQTVFAATSATIVSGAMAERTKFTAYLIYSLVISAVIYPISGHWIWGGGWLSGLGFHDFAGSTAVHMVGGVAAFVGAAMVGPRIGKYAKDGKSRAIPGHSLTLGALGVFILWFSWFGFNGASTVSATGDATLASMGSIFVNTNISAAVATTCVMFITWARYKKPDVSMTLNGALAGLVGITAGCDVVSPFGAAAIGLISAFALVLGVEFVDKKLKVDDPVGAVGVHGVCGAVGTICVGLFAVDGGLLYTGSASLLGVQAVGVFSVIGWVGVTMLLTFAIIKKTIGLRVSKEEELEGLDIHEHGLQSSYADFLPSTINGKHVNYMTEKYADSYFKTLQPLTAEGIAMDMGGNVPVQKAVPVHIAPEGGVAKACSAGGHDPKITKLSIITKESMFGPLEDAMKGIGITGMTVSNIMGYGMQKGNNVEYYRGVELESKLLPKIRVEIVVCKISAQTVIDAARKALYTGNIGDGKIFVYDVENVIKIRTGEQGYDALQDED